MHFEDEHMTFVSRDEIVGVTRLGHCQEEIVAGVGTAIHEWQAAEHFRKVAKVIDEASDARRNDVLAQGRPPRHCAEFEKLIT